MVKIVEVKTKKEQKRFLNFPLKIYKKNPCFVPPLYGDEKKIFRKDYIYNDMCDHIYFNAYKDGVMVGRISGILQKVSNELRGEKRVRFTRFDSINDKEVAHALFDAVEAWAKEKGMDTICGPLGFSDMDREGLLIEGFEELSTFEEQYNAPYYKELIEDCGYDKEIDWIERKLFRPEKVDERIEKLSKLMLKRYNLKVVTTKSTKEFIARYADKFFEIIDVTYKDLYGTVPFTDAMKKEMVGNFNLIIDTKHVAVIVDENDNVVCFGLCFPSLSKAMQKSGGKLTIPALFRVLKAIKHPKILDLALIGVLPEYANKGISSYFIYELQRMMVRDNIEYCETNLNMEDNVNIINMWKNFDNVIHKRRRSFVKKIA